MKWTLRVKQYDKKSENSNNNLHKIELSREDLLSVEVRRQALTFCLDAVGFTVVNIILVTVQYGRVKRARQTSQRGWLAQKAVGKV